MGTESDKNGEFQTGLRRILDRFGKKHPIFLHSSAIPLPFATILEQFSANLRRISSKNMHP